MATVAGQPQPRGEHGRGADDREADDEVAAARRASTVRARVSRTGHALRVVSDLDATSDPPAEPRAADGATTRAAELPDRLAYLRVIGLAALIGTPAALGAALFLALVHQIEHLLWTELPDALGASAPPWYLVIWRSSGSRTVGATDA